MNNTNSAIKFVAAALLLGATTANAATITTNFSGLGGDLGNSTSFGNIEVTAFNSSGSTANLYQSDAGTDRGLGVCNSVDDNGAACASVTDSGVNFEIDNNGITFDWIRLDVSTDKSDGGIVTGISLSSVQYRGVDTWSIWGNNTGDANGFQASDFIISGNTTTSTYVDVAIPDFAQEYSYYYITTANMTSTMSSEGLNHIMLHKLTQDGLQPPSAVPVPAAVWLLGSGLVGLVGVSRRKALVS